MFGPKRVEGCEIYDNGGVILEGEILEKEVLDNTEIAERKELCTERLLRIPDEETVPEEYRPYFSSQARKLLLLFQYEELAEDGDLRKLSARVLKTVQKHLYDEILPENYENGFSNPKYLAERFGKKNGRLLGYLAARLNSAVFSAAEGDLEAVVLLAELFIEIYVLFEEYNGEETFKECRTSLYSFEYDNMEKFAAASFLDKFDRERGFARDIILHSQDGDSACLYWYGEYVTENEERVFDYIKGLSAEKTEEMAKNVVDGFLRGFRVMQVDKKEDGTVQLRYPIGFERVMARVIGLLNDADMKVTAARTPVHGRHARKMGYSITNVNIQYDYDHRNDEGLLWDKKFLQRREEIMHNLFEQNKEKMERFLGPLVMETYGERLPLPQNTAEAILLDKRQQRLQVEFTGRLSELQEKYLPSDAYSFTIVAYPLPSVGENFEAIFEETLKLNELDNDTYIRIQQHIVDALDRADTVHVTGRNGNQTDLTVNLWKLKNPEKETIFENCTADVNIPVGEVFTSPVLSKTNGRLHVKSVFLGSTEYKDLTIDFADGRTTEYSCANYEKAEDNKSFIRENLLKNHDSLPLGEFAIGTNTTAYRMGQKYGITDVLPILIAEKTGPHFAIGDTCYSHSEDHVVYNPDGKEIVARTNECAELRHTKPEEAYFQCHTDITIPYSELDAVTAICKDGTEIPILSEGRFVLEGTEELNAALDAE